MSCRKNAAATRLTFREWKAQATSFDSLATVTYWPRTLMGFGPPMRMYAWRVSANYFTTLGVQPVLGRSFEPGEGIEGRGNVLIISSGGPIAAIVAAALNAPPATAVELNLRIRNSSLTEFASTPRRHHLVTFNGLPHLDTNPDTTLITYA